MTQVLTCFPTTGSPVTPELQALKSRQQAMWASGDFAVIGTTLQLVGVALCEAAELRAGSRVLDVACGNGNATLAAARRFCDTTGIDYVPALLERARLRAQAEGLSAELLEADAEHLPFADASFDAVLSTFGVMFTADHARAARELLRVCKIGGTIALASWTPEGFIGELLRTVGRHVPPPPSAPSALRWGSAHGLCELFGEQVVMARVERKPFVFRYLSADHFVEVFRRYYGPTYKAFAALDAAGQQALAADIMQLVGDHNREQRGAVAVPAEYLETVFERRR